MRKNLAKVEVGTGKTLKEPTVAKLLRMPPGLMDELESAARRESRSVNNMIVWILAKHLAGERS